MPHELAIHFMAAFSRAEYALKSTSYADGDKNRVVPAWDRYANEIHEKFIEIKNEKVIENAEFLLTYPPRKQTLSNGRLKYVKREIDHDQKSTQQLLLMVRTVRNNLFHGGKFLPDGEVETGRNQKLVEASLSVLLACISLNQKVYESYEH
jgi:hypothetical protein